MNNLNLSEAIRWTGKNIDEISDFCKGKALLNTTYNVWYVTTPQGTMLAKPGDYIAKDTNKNLYVYNANTFNQIKEKQFPKCMGTCIHWEQCFYQDDPDMEYEKSYDYCHAKHHEVKEKDCINCNEYKCLYVIEGGQDN